MHYVDQWTSSSKRENDTPLRTAALYNCEFNKRKWNHNTTTWMSMTTTWTMLGQTLQWKASTRGREHSKTKGEDPRSKMQDGSGTLPPGGDISLAWTLYGLARLSATFGRRSTATSIRAGHTFRRGCKLRFARTLLCIFMVIPVVSGLQLQQWQIAERLGEASNPGPWWIGSTNPSGLRNKEWIYGELPPGIWGCSETQLTVDGIALSKRALRHVTETRDIQLLHGSPAACRARSLVGAYAN